MEDRLIYETPHGGIVLFPVPEYPDYYVDSYGEAYSMKNRGGQIKTKPTKPRLLKKTLDPIGYFKVDLMRDKKNKRWYLHQLMLLVFRGQRPEGMFACHGVGGPLNNSVGNLYYATPQQNMLDRKRDGTEVYGEKNWKSKFRVQDIKDIRRLYGDGVLRARLAERYNVAVSTICAITSGRTWKQVVCE